MKKFISWDIFHLSLILSLLRLHPELYRSTNFEIQPLEREVFLGPSSAYTQTQFNNRLEGFIHPKNVDRTLVRTLFINDLNRLRPAWTDNPPPNDIIAYIVNGQQSLPNLDHNNSSENDALNSGDSTRVSDSEEHSSDTELTQEDMDLIEILWKQDIDLGISRDVFDGSWHQEQVKEKENITAGKKTDEQAAFDNPWHGIQYSIDSETGEHIIVPQAEVSNVHHSANDAIVEHTVALQEVPTVDFNDISIEEAFQFFETNPTTADSLESKSYQSEETERSSFYHHQQRLLDELQELVSESQNGPTTWANPFIPSLEMNGEMGDQRIERTHVGIYEPNMIDESVIGSPYQERGIDRNLMDIDYHENIATNLTGAPYTNFPNTIGASFQPHADEAMQVNPPLYMNALLRNSTMPMSVEELPTVPFEDDEAIKLMDGLYDILTNINGSDLDPFSALPSNFSNQNNMELLPGNMTADNDLISSILNQDSLDFFDLSEIIDDNPNTDMLAEASNDSAISCNNESRSTEDWQQSVFKQENTSSNEAGGNTNSEDTPRKGIGAAQKKYHFFGKNNSENDSSSESSDSGCSNSIESACNSPKNFKFEVFSKVKEPAPSFRDPFMHNHTYHQIDTASTKPIERNKAAEKEEEEDELNREQRCRDEKRAKELNLPLSIKQITTMPIDEFNEWLAKLDLTEEQITLIRDIRRRGKNKVAAQNCRKRKMDQIVTLQQTLEDLQRERQKLITEQVSMNSHRELLQSKYHRLYHFLFNKNDGAPSDPPAFFNNSTTLEEQHPPDFPIARNGTRYSQDLDTDVNKGARMKRKINKK